MVKASELTDQQLVEQIEKYEKIVKGLHRERERRVAADVPAENLMTAREKELLEKKEVKKKQATNTFTVEITDSDLANAADVGDSANSEEDDKEDMMRVTRLLQLSQKDLEELNKAKHEQQAKKRTEALKQRRKSKKS